jgi:hypothetical protein
MEKDADVADTLTPRGPLAVKMKILYSGASTCLNLHTRFPLSPRPVIVVKCNFDDGHDTNIS